MRSEACLKTVREALEMAAYGVVNNEITDQTQFDEYIEKIPQVVAAHGGRYLARGGVTQVVEGNFQPSRFVIIELENWERASALVNSPEYPGLSRIRTRSTVNSTIIVEGV